MATKPSSFLHVDEDYIDMEISSSSNLFSYSIGSPPQNREFEFQMTSISNEKDSAPSPADELFCKGKLLPLHLSPRLQMVQKLLKNSNATFEYVKSQSALEDNSFPFSTDLRLFSSNESCDISPSESCLASSEVNPDEYLFVWSTETNGFIDDLPKKSWSKKLKQIKQLGLGQRLKASRAYVKSLFGKSDCSDKSYASAGNRVGAEKKLRCKDCEKKYLNGATKNPFEIIDDKKHKISCAVMKTINREMLENGLNNHRRSFSGAIRDSATKASSLLSTSSSGSTSSSSFSFSSSGFNDLQLFTRNSSANLERESSIEGAIAHCRQSQQQCSSSKTPNEVRISSQFASKIAFCGNQETATPGSTLAAAAF